MVLGNIIEPKEKKHGNTDLHKNYWYWTLAQKLLDRDPNPSRIYKDTPEKQAGGGDACLPTCSGEERELDGEQRLAQATGVVVVPAQGCGRACRLGSRRCSGAPPGIHAALGCAGVVGREGCATWNRVVVAAAESSLESLFGQHVSVDRVVAWWVVTWLVDGPWAKWEVGSGRAKRMVGGLVGLGAGCRILILHLGCSIAHRYIYMEI